MYQGALKVEGLRWDTTDPEFRSRFGFITDTAARFTLDGQVGYGLFELMILGVYRPYGFTGWDTVAPSRASARSAGKCRWKPSRGCCAEAPRGRRRGAGGARMTNGHRRRGTTLLRGTTGRLVVATLLGALGTAHPAAAIDLSGDYVGFALVSWVVHVAQTGTALELTGYIGFNGQRPLRFSGSVDPDTGAFSATGEILPQVCLDAVISGTGDGEDLVITFTAPECPSGTFTLSKCGNGVLDPLENCEDSNFIGGDCCSARCRLDPPGTACTSDGETCTADVCDASGTCTHAPVPNPIPCDDRNPCTVADVCGGGACVPGAPAPTGQACPDDLDPCSADVCNPTGTCTHVPVPPAVCRLKAACHSTCTQELKACRQTCPTRGQARRDCREACAKQSTCTAPGAPIRTLAYVMNACTTDPQGRSSLRQTLFVRHGNCDPVPVKELDDGVQRDAAVCGFLGSIRATATISGSILGGRFGSFAVLPDGSGVIFEVTRVSSQGDGPPVEEGFFFVRVNGSGGAQWLAPPSRVSAGAVPRYGAAVSPDGRHLAFFDLDPDGAEQVFLLDVRPQAQQPRTQLTHHSRSAGDLCCTGFLDNRTVTYQEVSTNLYYRVGTDGSDPVQLSPLVDVPDGMVDTSRFVITGGTRSVVDVIYHGYLELFLKEGKNVLQLTYLKHVLTGTFGGYIARGRMTFAASANPDGQNPHEICQLFSTDLFGAEAEHPRQLTHLPWDDPVEQRQNSSCRGGVPNQSCTILDQFQDPITGTNLIVSSCDPVGNNPFGDQLFALRLDGTGLRQLTRAHGRTTDPDGTLHVELVGGVVYTPRPDGAH